MKRPIQPVAKPAQPSTISPLLDQDQAAGILNIAPATLCKWRSIGTGPRFIKVGRMPRYRLEDITAWLERRSSPGEAA